MGVLQFGPQILKKNSGSVYMLMLAFFTIFNLVNNEMHM